MGIEAITGVRGFGSAEGSPRSIRRFLHEPIAGRIAGERWCRP